MHPGNERGTESLCHEDHGCFRESPTWAGIVNAAGQFAASINAELTTIYNAYATPSDYAADYKDIGYGLCGFFDGNIASPKWGPCTGVGTPRGYLGK